MFYTTKWAVTAAYSFLVKVLFHSSCYTVAINGVDRYLRIKYCRNFEAVWTTRLALKLFCVAFYFLCFATSSTSIDRFCIRKTEYCYTNLYCSWWCCDRFDNIPSSSNYLNIKCSSQRVNSCCVRNNQQKDYQAKYANHVIVMRFHHSASNSLHCRWKYS